MIYEVNKRLHERNEQFRIVNDHLRDANKIKDSYVFRYMQLATHYIGRVDEYRMELRKTAKTDGTEALMRKLRSPSDVDRSYRDFYRIFDETFLGIFPDFVERVNDLLEEPRRVFRCALTVRFRPNCVFWPSCGWGSPTADVSPVF